MADLRVDGVVVDKSGFIQSYPVGTIIMRANTTIPDGWLLCDGSPVPKANYPALYAHLTKTGPATYGEAGSNFNLPPIVVLAPHNDSARIPVGVVSSEPTYPSSFPGHSHGTTTFNFPANVASGNFSHVHPFNGYNVNVEATQSHNHNRAGGDPGNAVTNTTTNLRASSTNTTQYLNQVHAHNVAAGLSLGNNSAVNNGHNHFINMHVSAENSSHTHTVSYGSNTSTDPASQVYPESLQLYFLIKT